jgi:hypothetical protein
MIDDMKIRNMSPNTQKAYIRAVKNFRRHFGKSPDKLTFEDVRAYELHLVSRGLQAATIIPIMCAIRFFYGTTLGRPNVAEHIPLARKADTLPATTVREFRTESTFCRHVAGARASFDHLVGQCEQLGRHGEAERIRGLTINDEFELGRQLNRKIGRLGAFENPIDVAACTNKQIG